MSPKSILMKYSITMLFYLFFTTFIVAQIPVMPEEMLEEVPIEEVEPIIGSNTQSSLGYFKEEGKYGLVKNSERITEAIYDQVKVKNPYGYIVQEGLQFGFVNADAQVIIPIQYDEITDFREPYMALKKDNKFGIYNVKGEEELPIQYMKVLGLNSSGQFVVFDKKNQLQLLTKGGELLASEIAEIKLYDNGAILTSANKYAFINSYANSGFIYDGVAISNFKKELKPNKQSFKRQFGKIKELIIEQEGSCGLIDSLHKVLIPIAQDEIESINMKNYYQIIKDAKKGVYLKKCNKYFPPEYDRAYMDGTRYLQLSKAGKTGLVDDATGEFILPMEYDEIYRSDPVFVITKDKKTGITDMKGQVIIPPQYEELDNLGGFLSHDFDGFYKVKSEGKYGVVNDENKVIIPVEYDWLNVFDKAFFMVKKSDQFGLFDLKGETVLKLDYDYIEEVGSPSAKVYYTKKEGLNGAIDKEGNVVLENEFKSIRTIPNTENDLKLIERSQDFYYQLIEREDGKKGVIDVFSGKLILSVQYDEIYHIIENQRDKKFYFSVKDDNKMAVIGANNQIFVDFKYDSLNLQFNELFNGVDYIQETGLVAQKNGQFGVINLVNKTLIPFQYKEIEKISNNGVFKAKKGDHYILINHKNQIINAGPFDDVSNYEYPGFALTFYQGNMREINEKGEFQTAPIPMKKHDGYTSFSVLKQSLIKALDSPDDTQLLDFAKKITPSDHLLYFFKKMDPSLTANLQALNFEEITKRYYDQLLDFKYNTWNAEYYNKENLQTDDYTVYKDGLTTNHRLEDRAYDDTRILEKILRNSLKINGYWISSNFVNY